MQPEDWTRPFTPKGPDLLPEGNPDMAALARRRLPHRLTEGFDGLYGLELLELSSELVRGRVAVRKEILQPAGLVHGGVYASVAESLASIGTAFGVAAEGKVAMGMANQTSFLRPVTGGHIEAAASLRHRGRSTWVWEVEMWDAEGRLCVLTRMTIAVRDARPG